MAALTDRHDPQRPPVVLTMVVDAVLTCCHGRTRMLGNWNPGHHLDLPVREDSPEKLNGPNFIEERRTEVCRELTGLINCLLDGTIVPVGPNECKFLPSA